MVNHIIMLVTTMKIRRLDSLFLVLFLHSTSTLVTGYGEKHASIESLTDKDINATVEQALYFLNKMKTLESNIINYRKLEYGTPNHGEYISFFPEKGARERGRAGWLAARSAQMMIARYCSSMDIDNLWECEKKISKYSFAETQLAEDCHKITASCPVEEHGSPYRSITGKCNHDDNAHEGESFTAYKRLLPPVYRDGVETVRRSANKQPLPNARDISAKFTKFSEINDAVHTMAVLQWAQFVEQDLSRVALSPMYHYDVYLSCCGDDGFVLAPRYVHKYCLPISISEDPFYSESFRHCMSYVRSMAAMRPDCSFGPIEQMNQATHFLDGSQIYGSSKDRSHVLRDFTNGKYRVTKIKNKEYLPLSPKPSEDCLYNTNPSHCFMSGDPRVNFEPQMTVMHTIWAREHNRKVEELTKLGNSWTPEEIFEEARRIVIAEIQHITYNEWVKEVLGQKYINQIDKYSAFLESVNPSVLNSVGVAVFRAFKSLYPDHIKLILENRNESRIIKLQDSYYSSTLLHEADAFDELIRGMATQVSGEIDMHYPEDLINKLFVSGDFGYDLLSLDIQRGRDHGLPPYNYFRKYLGFKDATLFSDFENLISRNDVHKLSQIYSDPNDVDLIIGGLLEQPSPNSIFGPTFSWLLTNQLIRTRRGDRYFYTNDKQPKPFTSEQLGEIKKVTLARIFCDNSDNIEEMQLNVFRKVDLDNTLVDCDLIDHMNMKAWSKNPKKTEEGIGGGRK